MARHLGWRTFALLAAVAAAGLTASAPTLAQPPGGRASPPVTPPAPPAGDPSTNTASPTFSAKELPAPPAAPPSPESSRPVDLADGESLFRQACTACHGAEAKGGQGGGPNLLSFPASYIAATATTGKGTAMPSFRQVFTADQLRDIAGYVSTTLAANK